MNNIAKILCPVFISLFLFSLSCKRDTADPGNYLRAPLCTSSFIPGVQGHEVVGFYPLWREAVMPLSGVPWNRLTRIVCAFATPNTDGSLNTADLSGISQIADSAHSHGVEIYISIGGADGSVNFPAMATNEKSRRLFINEVRQYIFENCLDGVDIDWEYWSGYVNDVVMPDESNALVSIVRELKRELSPFGLGISVDLGANDWAGKHFSDEIPEYVDDLMVMSYDFTGTWTAPGPHSAFVDAIGSGSTKSSTGLAYWVNYRRWPREHMLLGVPFYGKDFDQGGGAFVSYSDILDRFPDAWQWDQVNNIYYDGLNTMAEKAGYVRDNDFRGVMIWEITQDSRTDSLSLLAVIHNILNP